MIRVFKKVFFGVLYRIKSLIFRAKPVINKKEIEFFSEYDCLLEMQSKTNKRFELEKKDLFPCLDDKTSTTSFDAHYIFHLAWAARKIKFNNPSVHYDISSSLHFCTLLSAFLPVRFFDYRPAFLNLSDLESGRADLISLPFEDNSIESLSCMHTVEHIGLGRYGDLLDYDGDLKAINEMKRVVAKGGYLYLVVPVGKPRIMFNAHRIYDYIQVVDMFDGFQLIDFTLIPDNAVEKGIIINANPDLVANQNYGCGCFMFKNI